MTTTPPQSYMRRRILTLAGVGAVGLWVWGVPKLAGILDDDVSFLKITNAPGFQRLEGDGGTGLTSANALFAGLDAPDPAVSAALEVVKGAPCAALFGTNPAPVPVALFSDFNCPNCPRMDANVLAVLSRTPDTSLHRHQLPLLGRTSVTASRAVLAADRQGKYTEMHRALLRTSAVKDITVVRRFAQDAGVDPDQLVADMAHPDVAGALDTSKALSKYLGLIGTPAVVIGRTVALGVQSEATISAIIAHEKERGTPCS